MGAGLAAAMVPFVVVAAAGAYGMAMLQRVGDSAADATASASAAVQHNTGIVQTGDGSTASWARG
ncbi:MAG TPA: hypothetical protein VL652_38800 [Kutzneria sp.]|nr:hypothetical protein [Kutzneria sp.]